MVLGGCLLSFAQHPSLLFTQEEVSEIWAGKGMVPECDKSLSEVLSAADAVVNSSISVPVPIDGGGGAVHEQLKFNYYAMFHCGVAYQLTGDKNMLPMWPICCKPMRSYIPLWAFILYSFLLFRDVCFGRL